MFEIPVIDERLRQIAPWFRAVSIHVDATSAGQESLDPSVLAQACDIAIAGGPGWADAHLASWADTYIRFGAKPNRTPCSAQALRKRVSKDGGLLSINPVVDLYNAISIKYEIPVGGENYDAYVGRPFLTIADGTETFETVTNGELANDPPVPGEVIWRDDVGVTCRRWNWRQGTRTRLEAASGRMWFVLEAMETMPEDALTDASVEMADVLERLMPGCRVVTTRVGLV